MALSLSSLRTILKFQKETSTDLTDLKTEDSSFQCLRKSQVSYIIKGYKNPTETDNSGPSSAMKEMFAISKKCVC